MDIFIRDFDPLPDDDGKTGGRSLKYLTNLMETDKREAEATGDVALLWWEDLGTPDYEQPQRDSKRGRHPSRGKHDCPAGRGGPEPRGQDPRPRGPARRQGPRP